MPGSTTTSRLRRFLAVTVTVIVSLLALEIMVRLFFSPPQIVDLASDASPKTLETRGVPNALYITTDEGRRLRPNTVATIYRHLLSHNDVVLRTNSLGYRNPELTSKERPRLLFLGDSITFADYVHEKDTYVRIVQELSEETSKPVETVNAGVGATGLTDYFSILKKSGLGTNPDLVVVGLYLNDFQSSPSANQIQAPRFLRGSWFVHYLLNSVSIVRASIERPVPGSVSREELKAWDVEIQEKFPSIEPASGDDDAFEDLVLKNKRDWGGAWSSGAWKRMTEVLATMKPLLDRAGARMVIVMFPVRYQVDAKNVYDFPQRQARKVAQEMQVEILDLLPELRREKETSSVPLFYDHCHYTPHGNRVVATKIYEFLADIGV